MVPGKYSPRCRKVSKYSKTGRLVENTGVNLEELLRAGIIRATQKNTVFGFRSQNKVNTHESILIRMNEPTNE